jgi:hypothetical protein
VRVVKRLWKLRYPPVMREGYAMGRPPLLFAAYAILPTTGVIVRLKRTTSHRGALNYIHDNRGYLEARYNMTFYVGAYRRNDDE